jgi:FMNH2-dependent dimethyl sulfone monooxygenase
LKPKPLNTPERPNPEIFQGGNSTAARRNGGYYADWYFSNGKDFGGVTEQLVEVRDHARRVSPAGREVRFGLNGFIIARDTEKEAKDVLREIIEKANRPAVEGFALLCNRPATRRPTNAACGPTRRSRTWCSTTTGSVRN